MVYVVRFVDRLRLSGNIRSHGGRFFKGNVRFAAFEVERLAEVRKCPNFKVRLVLVKSRDL